MFARCHSAFGSMYAHQDLSLDDFLYLPSHLTVNRKAEIEQKFGVEAANCVDRDFVTFATTISKIIETCVLEMHPSLKGFLEDLASGKDPLVRMLIDHEDQLTRKNQLMQQNKTMTQKFMEGL